MNSIARGVYRGLLFGSGCFSLYVGASWVQQHKSVDKTFLAIALILGGMAFIADSVWAFFDQKGE